LYAREAPQATIFQWLQLPSAEGGTPARRTARIHRRLRTIRWPT